MKRFFLGFFLSVLCGPVAAAPGVLDLTFGNGGVVQFPFVEPQLEKLVLQPDGKLLAVGTGHDSGASRHIAISRHLANGALDATFGVGGKVVSWPGDPALSHEITAAALQGDGKLVVASYAFGHCLTARYDNSGALDATFGFGGYYVLYPESGCIAGGIAFDAAGNVFVGVLHSTTHDRPGGYAIMKLGADGFPDDAFGFSGSAEYPGNITYRPIGVVVQPDGFPVLYANQQLTVGSPDLPSFLLRFTPAGGLDSSFGSGGRVDVPYGSNRPGDSWMLELEPGSQRIAVAGAAKTATSDAGFQAVRFLPNGALDPSFGTNGRYVRGPDIYAGAGRRAPSGKYFFAASCAARAMPRCMEYAWLTADGQPDLAHGAPSGSLPAGGGLVDAPVNVGFIKAAQVQADGRAIVADRTQVFRIRFAPAASADFDADGKADLIYRHETTGVGYVWHMNGVTFDHDSRLPDLDPRWRVAAVIDWDGDGYTDLLVRDEATGDVMLRLLNATGLKEDAFLVNIAPGWTIEGAADLNGDGMTDIMWRNRATGDAFAWYMYGTAFVSDQLMFSVDPQWRIAGVADFDGDGQPDLLMRHATTGLAFIWYLNGATPSSDRYLFSIDPVWEIAMVADFNRDGSPDLVFRHRDTGVTFVWYVVDSALAGSDFLFQVDPSWHIPPGS